MILYKNEDDHQRWLRKTKYAAQGFEDRNNKQDIEKKYGKEISERPNSCYTCKKKNKCQEFRMKTTGGTAHSVSIDASVTFLCDKYDPMPVQKKDQQLSPKAVNNLLKRAKTGNL